MRRTIKVDGRSVSPFRQPAWRWLAAQQMHALGRRARRWEDFGVVDAYRYLGVADRNGIAAAQLQWPALAKALSIYRAAGVMRDELEARLIAVEPYEVIVAKSGVPMETISAFERFFFNVEGSANAGDWLLTEAVRIIPGQPVTEGQIWKYLGMAGGPVLVDLMVDDFLCRPCNNPAERSQLAVKGRYVVREFATGLQLDAAAAAIVEEGCQLFPHLFNGKAANSADQRILIHLEFLRLALGLDPLPQHSCSLKARRTGQRNAQKEKRNGSARKAKAQV
jgi:hypothetical protein